MTLEKIAQEKAQKKPSLANISLIRSFVRGIYFFRSLLKGCFFERGVWETHLDYNVFVKRRTEEEWILKGALSMVVNAKINLASQKITKGTFLIKSTFNQRKLRITFMNQIEMT